MPQVVYTKEFNKCLRDLLKIGKKGKDAVLRAPAAETEAGSKGRILSSRTHHGENRIPDAEKYNLGDGYRLVVQLVDGKKGIRAFLFAGDHDDAERWLQNHRDYRWVNARPTAPWILSWSLSLLRRVGQGPILTWSRLRPS